MELIWLLIVVILVVAFVTGRIDLVTAIGAAVLLVVLFYVVERVL